MWPERTSGRGQTDLDVVVDDVVEAEYRREGERQQTKLAYRIAFESDMVHLQTCSYLAKGGALVVG
jgi:hypothetical protein